MSTPLTRGTPEQEDCGTEAEEEAEAEAEAEEEEEPPVSIAHSQRSLSLQAPVAAPAGLVSSGWREGERARAREGGDARERRWTGEPGATQELVASVGATQDLLARVSSAPHLPSSASGVSICTFV